MAFTIHCVTKFDITATGVKSHYTSSRIPFKDNTGKTIANIDHWHCARNQQRNWETLNQLLSLRTFPDEVSTPVMVEDNGKRYWEFTVRVESLDPFTLNNDPLGALRSDCSQVPMLAKLGETDIEQTFLVPGTNIEFAVIENK